MAFEDEPRDSATDVNLAAYTPKLFTSGATTTSKVRERDVKNSVIFESVYFVINTLLIINAAVDQYTNSTFSLS